MSTIEIIETCVLGAAALALIVIYTIKAIKNKWVGQLVDTINEAIKEAEATGKSGEEKKLMVLDAVAKKCNELGIPYSLISTLISKLIDIIIAHYNVIAK